MDLVQVELMVDHGLLEFSASSVQELQIGM